MKITRGRITSPTKIEAGFAFALAAILAMGLSAYLSTQHLLQANQRVTHTQLVQQKLQEVLDVYQDAETGQRGFVLTGQGQYLEPYNAAIAHRQGNLDALKALISNDPGQQKSLSQLQTLSEAKFAEIRQTIELRQQSGLDAAMRVINTGQGQKLMDDLRGVVGQMQTREQQLLDADNSAAAASAHRTILIVAVWTPLSLLALALLALFVSRQTQWGGPMARPGTRGITRTLIALRYCFAVVTVALAALVHNRLEPAFGTLPLFITFYPAVILVASIAGGGPGVLATLLSALLADYFLIRPYESFAVASANDVLALSIFTGACLFLCVLAERLKRARWAEAVAQQKELLAVTLASIGDGVIVTDIRGRVTFLNQEAEQLTGWKLPEAEGRPLPSIFRIINEQTHEPVENPSDKVLRVGTVVGLANHTILLARDGREIPIDDSGAPVRDASGKVIGVVLVFRDFSEKKQVEKALARLASIVESSEDAVLSKGLDGIILSWNAAAERLFGYRPEEIIGKSVNLLLPPERITEEEQILARLRQGEHIKHLETIRLAKDGRRFDVAVTVSPLKDHDGQVVGVSKIIHDITQRKRAEEQLQLQSRVLQAADNAIVITDEKGTIQWVNPAFTRLTGYSAAEAIGQNPRVLKSGKHEEAFYKQIWQTITAGRVWHGELVNKRKDGRLYDEEMTITPVCDAGGKVTQFIAIKQDISERRRVDDNLHKLNRTLRALSGGNQAILHATDETPYVRQVCANIIDDCGHAMAWVGYALQDQDKTVEPVAHAGLEQGYLQAARINWADTPNGRGPTGTAIRNHQVVICNDMLTDPSLAPWRQEAANRGFASSIALPLMDDGHAFGALTIYSRQPAPFIAEEVNLLTELAGDLAHGIISLRLRQQHAQAMDALRQSQEQYHRLFNTLLEGFCIIEVLFDADNRPNDYRFLEINPAFETQTGLRRALGKRMRELAPDHEAHWFEIYGKVALTGQPARFINEAKALNRWYDVSAYRVGPADSRKVAVLLNDITERVRAERELISAKVSAERAKEAAEAAGKAKDQFLAVLSHELRTPLNPALLAATILEKEPSLSEELRQDVGVIRRNVELEARLIDDMLDLTRITRGKLTLARRIVDAREALTHAVETCHAEAADRALALEVSLPPEPIPVDADPARLQQVFWNLLKNAVKFTPGGGRIAVRAGRTADDGLRVEVSDTGRGIEPAALARIFDAFDQGDPAVTRRYGGLGLGLAICKGLVEMHDGSISAISPGQGKGSTFIVQLPPPSAKDLPLAQSGPGLIDSAPGPGASYRILLVEDHESTAVMTSRLLGSFGHDVTVVSGVQNALTIFPQQKFDLLISDLGLPDGSGQDLLRQLRAHGPVRAIALSGYGMDSDLAQSAQAGFLEHLIKPINAQQLDDAIKRAMATRAGPFAEGGK